VYQLKNPFRDGTTHVLFTPQDFTAHIHVRRPSGDLRSCRQMLAGAVSAKIQPLQ